MSSMLDIAIVCPNVRRADGQGRAMLELARAAARAGHRVTAYAAGLDPELPDEGVSWVRLGMPGPQMLGDVAFAARAARAMRGASHDLACVMGGCAFPRIPTVYYAQFCWEAWRATWRHIGAPSPYHRAHARLAVRMERRGLARAVRVLSASRRVAEEVRAVRARHGLAPVPVTVVPNGADLAEHPVVTPERRAAARERFGLGAGKFVIVFIGEFNTPRKGLAPLVRAVGMGTDPSEVLVVAGGGRAERLGVEVPGGRVRFLGHVVPVAPVIEAADVVCLPSMYEALSVVTLEAAASGVPLVVSDRTGASEHLEGACEVVPAPCDPAALRAALDRLKSDPAGASRMARRARAIVEGMDWGATSMLGLAELERAAGDVPLVGSREGAE
jgi:glycosyltransferase involved in cell wall biosynthesis